MPVTKTAKRALRVSKRKKIANDKMVANMEASFRKAQKSKSEKDVKTASSFADRAVKKKLIHKNKAARIKSQLSKLLKDK